jgi:hypothetical protein
MAGHPARFPLKLPALLTDPGEFGSRLLRRLQHQRSRSRRPRGRWLSFELDREYAALSAVRFLDGRETRAVQRAVAQIAKGKTRSFVPSD